MELSVGASGRRWDDGGDETGRGSTCCASRASHHFGTATSKRTGLLAGDDDQSRHLLDPGVESQPIEWVHGRILTWAYWLYGTRRVWGCDPDAAFARETGISPQPTRLARRSALRFPPWSVPAWFSKRYGHCCLICIACRACGGTRADAVVGSHRGGRYPWLSGDCPCGAVQRGQPDARFTDVLQRNTLYESLVGVGMGAACHLYRLA